MAVVGYSLLAVLMLVSLIQHASGKGYTVSFNESPVWTVGIGVPYSDITIDLGSTLSFTSSNAHDVVLLTPPASGAPWDLCTMTGIAASNMTGVFATADFAVTNSEKHYTPPACGVYYFACSVPPHCAYGQRVKATVNNQNGNACDTPCTGVSCVTTASKQLVTATLNVHAVKPALPVRFWGIAFYDDMTVNIGDTVLFKTGAGFHDVATVASASAYTSCTMADTVIQAQWDYASGNISSTCKSSAECCAGTSCGKDGMYATYTYTATTAGDVYFVCSIGGGMHCQQGQKFKLTVNPPGTTSSASNSSDSNSPGNTANTATSPTSIARGSALVFVVFAFLILRL